MTFDMSNPIPPGAVKSSLERTKADFDSLKAKLKTYEGQMEILYEMLADGDIDVDLFNKYSGLTTKAWNK
jgi:hypothetical protein